MVDKSFLNQILKYTFYSKKMRSFCRHREHILIYITRIIYYVTYKYSVGLSNLTKVHDTFNLHTFPFRINLSSDMDNWMKFTGEFILAARDVITIRRLVCVCHQHANSIWYKWKCEIQILYVVTSLPSVVIILCVALCVHACVVLHCIILNQNV